MSKQYARFLSGLFCGFLFLVFAANLLTPDQDFSPMENRNLAQRPQISASDFQIKDFRSLFLSQPGNQAGDFFTGKLMADYEEYVTDQFVLRDSWVSAKAWSERLLGKQENNGVYFCREETLITRFAPPDPERLSGNLSRVDSFGQNASVPVFFGLIPTQAAIWSDRLPAGAPNYDQRLVLDAARQLSGPRWVDFDAILTAHSEEEIFYRTDHHWTSLGAYYGYVALMESFGRGDEVIPLSEYEKATVSADFYGTVFSSSGVRWLPPDQIDVYVPEEGITVTSYTYDAQGQPVAQPRQLYEESYLSKKDKYSMFLGGQQPLGVVETGNSGKPKLLLIRDSYSDSLVPFLTPHFSEIHLMDLRYCKLSPQQYLQDHGIDMAAVLYSVPNFVSDTNLIWLDRA